MPIGDPRAITSWMLFRISLAQRLYNDVNLAAALAAKRVLGHLDHMNTFKRSWAIPVSNHCRSMSGQYRHMNWVISKCWAYTHPLHQ
ncbi:hypothetical protein SRHO_G00186640 [Serrasalmus rhombeus]